MERVFGEWEVQGLFSAGSVLLCECDSTHKWLRREYKSLPVGCVVVADFQSAGTGRHARHWAAPKGKNLSFNVLLPLEGLRREFYACVTQVAAITFARLLAERGIEAAVKWPNDILVSRRKICGIISELLPGRLLSLGVGLNVNAERSDLEVVDKPATSMFIESGVLHDREAVLRDFISAFEGNFALLRERGLSPWIAQWREFDCFAGTRARVCENGNVMEGVIEGICDNGSLLFRTDKGLCSVWAGDLEV